MKDKLRSYFFYFLIYSFIGWLYELFLCVFVFHLGFVNRGFMFGPYLPVYGFGSLTFIFCLDTKKDTFKHKYITTFLGVTFLTTTLELITSYVMEFTMGEWLWDYNDYAFNFQGRITPETSIRFGLGGLLILFVIHPWLKKITNKYGTNLYFKWITFLMIIFFAFDLLLRAFFGSNFVNPV